MLWRGSAARLAVRWLYGAAGQDGTPVADLFAAESAAAGWKVVSAVHGPDAEPVSPGSQDAHAAGSVGLLMIVEHADRWLFVNLTWLLKNALLRQSGTATRVLMVARTADRWPGVRAILDTYQVDASSQHYAWPKPGTGPSKRHVRCGTREFRQLQLEQRDEDLTAARAANRELMAQLNHALRHG